MALKSETISLAISLELPLLVIDIQRGGPSTGLPTKTEAADLNLALYGRHAEAPLPVVAAYSPSHCFDAAIEAARIALEVPDAGDPAVRRLHRQRRRAVAAARRRDAARHLGARSPPSSNHERRRRDARVLAVPARPGDAGPAVGHPRHARARCTASAASRRRTAPATSPTSRRTTSAWSTCGRPRWPGSPTTSRPWRCGAPPTPTCSWSAGARRGRAIDASVERLARQGTKVALGPPRPPQPVAVRTWARSSAATAQVVVPEMNIGQLSPAPAGRVPGRRQVDHQGRRERPFTADELEHGLRRGPRRRRTGAAMS